MTFPGTAVIIDRSPDVQMWTDRLMHDGYCIIRDLVDPSVLAAIDADLGQTFAATPFCTGGFYGARTKRFGSLLHRSPRVAPIVLNPLINAIVSEILGGHCDTVQLNLTQAIEIHPGAPAQFPHRDHDMWPAEKGGHEYLVNILWPITRFTAANGATLIYPGSHIREGNPAKDAGSPIAAECEPGSAIVMLGSTRHGAGGNRSLSPRRAMIAGYCLGWLKPYENQWLAYPPEIARDFPPELAALVGYRQHRPNLGNYEGQCPSILLGEAVPAHLGAIDALRPEQTLAVSAFVADQAGVEAGERASPR